MFKAKDRNNLEKEGASKAFLRSDRAIDGYRRKKEDAKNCWVAGACNLTAVSNIAERERLKQEMFICA